MYLSFELLYLSSIEVVVAYLAPDAILSGSVNSSFFLKSALPIHEARELFRPWNNGEGTELSSTLRLIK